MTPRRAHGGVTVTLRELAWAIHRRAPERAGVPIPTTELALLKQVIEAPGSTVSELSEALGLRQPNTSAAIRVLVGRGLVTRAPDPDDRRVVRIRPTLAAPVEHRAIAAAWAGSVERALESLPAESIAAIEAAAPALKDLERAIRAETR